jgi:HEPN domain-containing protein
MVKSKKFNKQYAHELMSIAHADLESAFDLQKADTKRKENIYLLAQQALEKALKAVLCWHEKPVPFIHDISALVALVGAIEVPPFGYDLNDLTEFAAIRRYLEGYEEYSAEEVAAVLRAVKDALVWCKSKVTQHHSDDSD